MQGKTDPFLDDGMRGFIMNTARKNCWRVSELTDLPDLVQDGYLCYYKCKRAYASLTATETPTNRQIREFQALVKTTFLNHIHTLAAKHKGISIRPASSFAPTDPSQEVTVLEEHMPPQQETASLLTLLSQAPEEIKQLIVLLAGDGAQALGFKRSKAPKQRRELRETTNEYFCRLLGRDPATTDMVAQVRAYLE